LYFVRTNNPNTTRTYALREKYCPASKLVELAEIIRQGQSVGQ
jgi:hypothetical protein